MIAAESHDIGINFRAIAISGAALFYRAGDSTVISAKHARYLSAQLGIRAFLDLRSRAEVLRYGAPAHLIAAGIRWVRAPLTGYSNRCIQSRAPDARAYFQYYQDILEQAHRRLPRIFRLLACLSEQPFMLGCHFGKDRTGLVTACLMHLLGFPDQEIISDYSATARELLLRADHFQDKWLKRGHTKQEYLARLEAKAETMQLTLMWIEDRYGGIEPMLLGMGVNARDLLTIRSNLLERRTLGALPTVPVPNVCQERGLA